MTPSEDLFKLIRSLTPNEKGYFKKFSKIHVREGKNNYMMLFEAIEKQVAYDEEAIIYKFRNEQFVKQFPVAKNYLYNLVLKALDVYHSGVDLEIGYLIHCSIILSDKAMFEPALKFLKRAEALAQEHHKLSYLNKILNHELFILRGDASPKKAEILEQHFKLRVENADQLRYVIEYQHLYDLMNIQYSGCFGLERENCIREAEKLMKHQLIKNVPDDLSIYALIEYLYTTLLYHSIKQEYEKAYAVSAQLANKILKENEHILPKRTKIIIMQQHCHYCISTGRLDEATEIIEKLKMVEAVNELERLTVFQFVYRQELILYLSTVGFEKSALVLEKISSELDEFEPILQGNQKGFIFCLAAITCFSNGKYKEALKWTHSILNGKLSEFRNDIVNCAKLLEILIFHETGKSDVIHYKLESFERSFKKEREKHKFEFLAITHLKKIVQLERAQDISESALKAKKELDAFLVKSPLSQDVFYRFDLRDWLQSKSTSEPLSKIIAKVK